MLERLVNETLTWCVAFVCALGILGTIYVMGVAYDYLNMLVMF